MCALYLTEGVLTAAWCDWFLISTYEYEVSNPTAYVNDLIDVA